MKTFDVCARSEAWPRRVICSGVQAVAGRREHFSGSAFEHRGNEGGFLGGGARATNYVKELNEGVARMFDEMRRFGLREPLFTVTDATVKVTLFKTPDDGRRRETEKIRDAVMHVMNRTGPERWARFVQELTSDGRVRTSDDGELLGVSAPTARGYMRRLEELGLVVTTLKSSTDPTRYWSPTDHSFWSPRA